MKVFGHNANLSLSKSCVVAAKGNELHIYRGNLHMWANMTEMSDVAHGRLGFVSLSMELQSVLSILWPLLRVLYALLC
jgi:hypothetical protein